MADYLGTTGVSGNVGAGEISFWWLPVSCQVLTKLDKVNLPILFTATSEDQTLQVRARGR